VQKPNIILTKTIHNNVEIIKISFTKNDDIQQRLKNGIKELRWSKTHSSWYAPLNTCPYVTIYNLLNDIAYVDYKNFIGSTSLQNVPITKLPKPIVKPTTHLGELNAEHTQKINEFKNWLQSKRYSQSTIGTYIDSLTTFLRYFYLKPITEIDNHDLINFNNQYIIANKFSASYQNQIVNAVKLFFNTVQNKKLHPELIHRPKRPKVLPNVLSKQEVKLILNALTNIKHRAMLSLIYACGLRCGELIKLKPQQLDVNRKLVIIIQAKGRKDRIVPLSDKILNLINEYLVIYKPITYLFEGQTQGQMYDERSLQQVLKNSLSKTNINKPVTLHWLRHSYATHLLENGTDLRYIQEILGHSSSRTTEIYTHVSNKSIQKIISPFDYL